MKTPKTQNLGQTQVEAAKFVMASKAIKTVSRANKFAGHIYLPSAWIGKRVLVEVIEATKSKSG